MTKQEFLEALKSRLSDLPKEEIQERLSFYSEMIDDYMEEGSTEEEAVERIGIIDEAMVRSPEKKKKPRRKLKLWAKVLLIAGSPIWISLLAAAAGVVVSIYSALWSAVVSLWAVEVSLIACIFSGVVISCVGFLSDNSPIGWAALGLAIFCAGAAIFLFHGCKAASKGAWYPTKQFPRWVKALVCEKEDAQ